MQSFSIGQYSLTGGGVNAWVVGTDPVFEIGNGFSSSAKSNMLTVQKSGNVKIGDMTDASEVITEKLVVDGRIVVGDIPPNSTTAPVPGTVRWTGTDFEGSDGTDWKSLTAASNGGPYAIGDFAQGGVVFWVSPSEEHGKVVSIYDIGEIPWSNIYSEIGLSAQSEIN